MSNFNFTLFLAKWASSKCRERKTSLSSPFYFFPTSEETYVFRIPFHSLCSPQFRWVYWKGAREWGRKLHKMCYIFYFPFVVLSPTAAWCLQPWPGSALKECCNTEKNKTWNFRGSAAGYHTNQGGCCRIGLSRSCKWWEKLRWCILKPLSGRTYWRVCNKCSEPLQMSVPCETEGDKASAEGFTVPKTTLLVQSSASPCSQGNGTGTQGAVMGIMENCVLHNGPWSLWRTWRDNTCLMSRTGY